MSEAMNAVTDSRMLVQAVEIEKSYPQATGELRVLKGVDMEIRTGEFIAIIGLSGVGKSTLLNILGLGEFHCSRIQNLRIEWVNF